MKPRIRKETQSFARTLRTNPTNAELLLWRHLRANQLGTKFRRQFPFGPYVLDFVALDAKLVVEVDGGQHAEAILQDEHRTRYLAAHGFRVLRYWNNQVFNEVNRVVEDIHRALQPHPNPSLRAGEGISSAPAAGVKPATYGASERPPRGDYSLARADYTCDQNWRGYTAAEHDRYRRLYADRFAKLPALACNEYLQTMHVLDAAQEIPRFEAVSDKLRKATGWELAGVPGLIPENAFFSLLAKRRFPITTWLRTEEEFNYIVEPDCFHDFFGHVPLLFNPVFADYMQAFGQGGLKADGLHALEYLARLYWYTVEFGLINTADGLKVYGAGILSSGSEPQYALFDPKPQRIGFDLLRVMATRYKIDDFQHTYFVIESFDQLFEATAPDFTPYYAQLAQSPTFDEHTRLAQDKFYPPRAR
jgi:phenylalanine-4-hydroxylase